MTAEEWQAWAVWAAWATFGVYFILGIFAWVQVLQAKRLRESQALQARELREAEARPYVVVDFEPGDSPIMNLVVVNLGRTMARNVRIEADPPLQSGQDGSWPVPLAKLKLFTEPIPSLAPGKRIVLLFDLLHTRPDTLPSSYEVRLSYEWEGGKPLTDVQRLDLDLYRNLVAVRRDSIHHVNETLKKIVQRFDRWTAGHDGLLVLSPEDRRRRNEEIMAEMEQRRAAENGHTRLAGRLVEVVGRLRRRG